MDGAALGGRPGWRIERALVPRCGEEDGGWVVSAGGVDSGCGADANVNSGALRWNHINSGNRSPGRLDKPLRAEFSH